MKTPFLILFVLLTASEINIAQIEIHNTSLTQPDLKILYVGADNKISLTGTDENSEYVIKSASSEVIPVSDNSFIIKTSNNSTSETLLIFENNILIKTVLYEIAPLAVSTIRIGEISGLSASINDILSNPVINASSSDFYSFKLDVIFFQMTVQNVDDDILKKFEKTAGKLLTTEQLDAIKLLQPGDKIIISEIYAVGSDGIRKKLNEITVSIVL